MSIQRTKRVAASVSTQILDQMLAAPEKTKPDKSELTMRELIAKLYDGIVHMKSNGYDAKEICAFLQEQGAPLISPITLNNYLRLERKARKKSRKKEQSQIQSRTAIQDSKSELCIDKSQNLSSDASQTLSANSEAHEVPLRLELAQPTELTLEHCPNEKIEVPANLGIETALDLPMEASINKKSRFNNLLLDKRSL